MLLKIGTRFDGHVPFGCLLYANKNLSLSLSLSLSHTSVQIFVARSKQLCNVILITETIYSPASNRSTSTNLFNFSTEITSVVILRIRYNPFTSNVILIF